MLSCNTKAKTFDLLSPFELAAFGGMQKNLMKIGFLLLKVKQKIKRLQLIDEKYFSRNRIGSSWDPSLGRKKIDSSSSCQKKLLTIVGFPTKTIQDEKQQYLLLPLLPLPPTLSL